jgi:uncharacterized protein YecT (DUF1311 family)
MSLSNRFILLLSLCCVSHIACAEDIGFTKQYTVCMDKSDGVTSNMIDCIVAETKHQDARLNKVYKAFMAELSAERKKQLQTAQRAWITYRDANCNFYFDPDGGTIARVNSNSCFMSETATRAKELETLSGISTTAAEQSTPPAGQAQAPTSRNLSPAERLAMDLGPNKTAGCLSVSFRFIGLFSGGAPGSELANARNLYIRYAEVFLGVSKLQDKSQFDTQMNGFKENVKQASPQNLKDYFESNCSQPEVNQLVQSGWK